MYYNLLVLIIMLLQLIAQYSQKPKIIYATYSFNHLVEYFYLNH